MPVGRPSVYKSEIAAQAAKLCEYGLTEPELADCLGVSKATITNWKGRHPEFLAALKAGKAIADERVERSLYHRAVGYQHEAVKIFMPAGADHPVYAPYTEHFPPDTTACIFWLKNRRAREWRDIQRHEIGQPGDFSAMNDAELMEEVISDLEDHGADPDEIRQMLDTNGTQH